MVNRNITDNIIENSGQMDPVVMFKIVAIILVVVFVIAGIYALYQMFSN